MKNKIIGICLVLLILAASFAAAAAITPAKGRVHQHLDNMPLPECSDHSSDKLCTHLPLVQIDTAGQEIPGRAYRQNGNTLYTTSPNGEDRITVRLTVTDHENARNHTDDVPEIDSSAEIHVRGHSSRYFDKPSYKIKLIDSDGKSDPKSVMGMAEHSDWILNGPFLDKTLMRNYIFYNLSGELMEYAPNVRFCELILNGSIECSPAEFVYEAMYGNISITLIRKKNGGKADSLNMGINACRFPYFICMDADSILQYDSLSKIVKPVLENENVIAVGGAIRPANSVEINRGRITNYKLPSNIIACMQLLEYDRSFLASRILFDKFNGSLIISGAFGLFKKEAVIAAGGYDPTTMGEDMELVVKLHDYYVSNDLPYHIRYATDAVCWSQVPEKLGDLCKQRRRWHIGLFQSLWKHKAIFANPKFGLISFVSYFYFLFYELLSPYIELAGIFVTALAVAVDLINIPFMLLFFAIYAVFGAILTLTAFFARIHTIDLKVSLEDCFKATALCLFEISALRFALVYVRATAFIGYKKKKLHWGSIERRQLNVII